MPDGYSGILIAVNDNKLLNKTMQETAQALAAENRDDKADKAVKVSNLKYSTQEYEVYSWQFTMERLLQTAQSDKAFGEIVLFILYMIVGFGILGTVIMLTNERKREFSVMISLGMQRGKLALTIAFELLIMSLLGLALSLLPTIALLNFFAVHPILLTGEMAKMYSDMGMEPVLPTCAESFVFIKQIIIILTLSILAMIYPVRKIFKHSITNR
jgi:ABC-type lipoprotein release transport system permease subunit